MKKQWMVLGIVVLAVMAVGMLAPYNAGGGAGPIGDADADAHPNAHADAYADGGFDQQVKETAGILSRWWFEQNRPVGLFNR